MNKFIRMVAFGLSIALITIILSGCGPAEDLDPSSEMTHSEQGSETSQDFSEATSLFELNEDGFFTEPFCKTIDLDGTVEYSAVVGMFYFNLKEEARIQADSYTKVDDIYESASLTFYPNGKVRLKYKLTDKLYSTFSERELWPLLVPQQMEDVFDYTVDPENSEITLSDRSIYTIDISDGSITREFLLANEVFAQNAPVEGVAPTGESVKNQIKIFTLIKDIQYDSEVSNDIAKMDVFLPDDLDKSKDNSVIFIVYGGAWTGGTKEGLEDLAEPYAQEGYFAVTMNLNNAYHNEETGITEITVFDMLNDLHASVKKLKELSDDYGWNITQCAMLGGSSGGNIALTYAYSRGSDVPYFRTEEILPVKFAAAVVAPVDMRESAWHGDSEWLERDIMTAPGAGPLYAALLTGSINDPNMSENEKEKHLNAMSPVWYVYEKDNAVPTVMGYSKRDPIQNPNNGKILKGYLDEKSIRNDLIVFPNSIHSWDNDPEEAEQFFDKILEYAETYFDGN